MRKEKSIFNLINGLMLNKYSWQYKKLIKQSEYWDKEQIKSFQFFQLKKILSYSYQYVPYYQKIFKECKFRPESFKQIDDIKRIPVLTKSSVRKHFKKLISSKFKARHRIYAQSGGSTGKPIAFYVDRRFFSPVEWVFMKNQWERVGYKFRDKCVVLRGNVIKQIVKNKLYWKYDINTNWLVMSSFHMNEYVLPLYIKKIKKFRPKYIQAYPSVLYAMATFMKKHKIPPVDGLKALLLGSENIYDWQNKLFEEVFQARAFSWYGHSERCIMAGQCELSDFYHVFPQYGYAELINKNGEWSSKDGEEAEIVATSFTNYAFPFIRYKTQDVAINLDRDCDCGRRYKLLENVTGRLQDFFIDRFGNMITLTTSDEPLYSVQDKINSYQYVQNEPGKLMLNLDIRNHITKIEIDNIKYSFLRQYPGFDLNISVVDHIKKTKSGKFRYFIQKMPIKFSEE
jgi:phenylacetate-CoA ligase